MSVNPDGQPSPSSPRVSPIPVGSPEDLGQAIRRRRRRLGLSQEALADHLGVPRPYLSELEGGKDTLHLRRLLDTLRSLGLDVYLHPRAGRSGKR